MTPEHRHQQRRGNTYSRANQRRPTRAETACAAIFDSMGLWYKRQAFFFTGSALYLPDFRLACAWHKVIVEVDGSSHIGREEYDRRRTAWLAANRNAVVVRFTNEDVLERPDVVRAWAETYTPALLRR